MAKGKELFNRERKCHVCGRVFLHNPEWVYKAGSCDHEYVFCSWGCLRKWENTEKKGPIERREMIITRLKDGKDPLDIAREMNEDRSKVVYWFNKLKREGAI